MSDRLTVQAFLAMDASSLSEQQMAYDNVRRGVSGMLPRPFFSETVQALVTELVPKVEKWPSFPHELPLSEVPYFDERYHQPDIRHPRITFQHFQNLVARYVAPVVNRSAVEYDVNYTLENLKNNSRAGERETVRKISGLYAFRSLAGRAHVIRMAKDIGVGANEIPHCEGPFEQSRIGFHTADVLAVADLAENSFAYDPDKMLIVADFKHVIAKLPIFMDGKMPTPVWEFQAPRTLW